MCLRCEYIQSMALELYEAICNNVKGEGCDRQNLV